MAGELTLGEVVVRFGAVAQAAHEAGTTVVTVGTGSLVARYVELGTRPHTIVPTHKQALFWEGAPHPVRSVRHPGTAPNPFLRRGADVAAPKIAELLAGATVATLEGDVAAIPQAIARAGEVALAAIREQAPVGHGQRPAGYVPLRSSLTTETRR